MARDLVSYEYHSAPFPDIVGIEWLSEYASQDTPLPYKVTMDYEGNRYEVYLAYDDERAGYYIKSDCPYFSTENPELLIYRLERYFDSYIHKEYQKKYYRVSEIEKENSSDMPVVLGLVRSSLGEKSYRKGVATDRICVLFFQDRFVRYYYVIVDEDFKRVVDKDESSDLFGFGYPYREEDYEAFNEWILSLCRECRDQLDDGVFIEREDMAEQIEGFSPEYIKFTPRRGDNRFAIQMEGYPDSASIREKYESSGWKFVEMGYFRDDSLKIIDANWISKKAEFYYPWPFEAEIEYLGNMYSIEFTVYIAAGYIVDTECPYFISDDHDLKLARCERFRDLLHGFYWKKFFRVSDEENELSFKSPIVVGLDTNSAFPGEIKDRLDELDISVFYLHCGWVQYCDMCVTGDFKEFIRWQTLGLSMDDFSWENYDKEKDAFLDDVLRLCRKYSKKIYDGVVVKRDKMAKKNGCPHKYWRYIYP